MSLSSSEQEIFNHLSNEQKDQLSQLYHDFERFSKSLLTFIQQIKYINDVHRTLVPLYLPSVPLEDGKISRVLSKEEKYQLQRLYTVPHWVMEQYLKQERDASDDDEKEVELVQKLYAFRVAYDLTHQNKLSPNFFWGLLEKIADISRDEGLRNIAVASFIIGGILVTGGATLSLMSAFSPVSAATLSPLMLPALKFLGGVLAALIGYAALALSLPRVKDQFMKQAYDDVDNLVLVQKYGDIKIDDAHMNHAKKDRHLRPFDSLGFFKHRTPLSLELPYPEEQLEEIQNSSAAL